MVPANATFAEKRSAIAKGLQSLAAAFSVIPPRPSAQEVNELTLSPTSAPVHGGAHQKTFYADTKGRTWMFKVDGTGGAKAVAEAAASEIFHKAGLPAVPVFSKHLEGKAGSFQPIVPHSGTVVDQPQTWSQEDVDSMVRFHVASWLVGDHDGNANNVLRTPGGGLVPIDQGQAWKFLGRDKLDVHYHPNSSFGVTPPVYHRAYQAAVSGSLAAGVTVRPEAATPIIDRIDAISDDDFRTLIEPVATAGVKSGVPWVGPMTKDAQKRFGTPTPSKDQIAQAFIEASSNARRTSARTSPTSSPSSGSMELTNSRRWRNGFRSKDQAHGLCGCPSGQSGGRPVVVPQTDLPFVAGDIFDADDYLEPQGFDWDANSTSPEAWFNAGFGPGGMAAYVENEITTAGEAKTWFEDGFGPVVAGEWKEVGFYPEGPRRGRRSGSCR